MITAEERRRAGEALELLDSSAFRAAVAEIDAGYVAQWRGAASVAEREAAYAAQAVLHDVVGKLRSSVQKAAREEMIGRVTDGPFTRALRRIGEAFA